MQANITGVHNLLEYAHKKSVKKVIYVSSSEVYGRKESLEPFKEDQYGFIDLLNPRSSYSIAKRAAETMCVSYHAEYGVPFNVVRLGHIYGPSASRSDKRVSSDFAYKAAEGENLVLKSEGKQIRSYCYSLDCASAILSVLTSGVDGEAYNISNKDSIINIRDNYISSCTLGIYLLHDGVLRNVIWDEIIKTYNFNNGILLIFQIALTAILISIVGVLVDSLYKIIYKLIENTVNVLHR